MCFFPLRQWLYDGQLYVPIRIKTDKGLMLKADDT